MSVPVSQCLFYSACSDEAAYKVFLDRMRINLAHGAFTIAACRHDPKCVRPADDVITKLDARLREDLRKKPRS